MKTIAVRACFGVLVTFVSATIQADPLPGESLAFTQRPMIQTNIFGQTFFGHDEVSTAVQLPILAPSDLYRGSFIADDLAVKTADPITHVRLWGSYLQNQFGGNVQKFFIAFEPDIPQGPNNPFSRPAVPPIVSQIVQLGPLSPASGTFTEKLIHPGGAPLNENLFEYNVELAAPFVPTPNTVYWLKVVALTESVPTGAPKFQWGWHNRDYTLQNPLAPTPPAVTPGEIGIFSPIPEIPPIWHFQDDAVAGLVDITDFLLPRPGQFEVTQTQIAPQNYRGSIDGLPSIEQSPKDLAFELYTVPEPSTLMLVAASTIGIVLMMRRRQSSVQTV